MTTDTKVEAAAPPEQQNLNLKQIRTDGGTQPRVAIDEAVVAEYAEAYANSITLPPLTVFYDGANYWLADGFHRYWANKKINCEWVFALVHQGTKRDAVLYSVGANADHGLRRTNADKRKAVLIMLEDEEWSQWSNCEIAKRCGVSEATVRRTRDNLTSSKTKLGACHSRRYKRQTRLIIPHEDGQNWWPPNYQPGPGFPEPRSPGPACPGSDEPQPAPRPRIWGPGHRIGHGGRLRREFDRFPDGLPPDPERR